MSSRDHYLTISYLARLARKHDLDASEFLDCIRDAWMSGESKCKHMNISCRKKEKDSAIFLFTTGSDVAGQFPVPISVLQQSSCVSQLTGQNS